MSRYRTPLRYPGGKQKLWPFVSEVLSHNDASGGHYVEPFAGGAGVAIELLTRGLVECVHLNDSSLPVYAFWRSVLVHTDELCARISAASLTVEEWLRRREVVRSPETHEELEVGFSTLYLNRCNRSGVLSGGLIGGLNQTGRWLMDARFNRNELIRRIELIAVHADAIFLRNWDAERFICEYVPTLPDQAFVYCDPPYFHKSSRLYLNHYQPDDHERLANVVQSKIRQQWMVSYDNATEIRKFYAERQSFAYDIQYNAARAYKGREVFFFSDRVRVPARSVLLNIDVALPAVRL